MSTPIDCAFALVIGNVTSVSPDEIFGVLERAAPQAISINNGIPSPFPRINGYVLIPNEVGAIVGMVSWLGIEGGPTLNKRSREADPTLVNLPIAIRKICIIPVGTLICKINTEQVADEDVYLYELLRGISSFPSIGDSILLPTQKQLRGIAESTKADARLWIGNAPLAANAKVRVDPDKLFGRHVAVLGNTGSGKSCSVAGLIRWSLESAFDVVPPKPKGTIPNSSSDKCEEKQRPNARFIILDPSGEYTAAFKKSSNGAFKSSILTLNSRDPSGNPLVAPHWAWTVDEWTSILRTGAGFQGPLLRMSLQQVKNWSRCGQSAPGCDEVIRFLALWPQWLTWVLGAGPKYYGNFKGEREITSILRNAIDWLSKHYSLENSTDGLGDVSNVIKAMEKAVNESVNGQYQNDYNPNNLQEIIDTIKTVLGPHGNAIPQLEGSPERPCPFSISELEATIEVLADRMGSDAGWSRNMLLRLRRYAEDPDICSAIDANKQHTLVEILNNLFGHIMLPVEDQSQVIIVDLSFVPRDILHTVIAVTGRLIFEALQWYRHLNEGKLLPTTLVLEEAHTFIHGSNDSNDDQMSPSQMCRRTFERIAREGRKFGLGLVISSQRPSELSPTILSQCNTFLLHRIVNDRDQDLVRRLVPDGFGSLLRELPTLPTKKAILLGLATQLPVLVEMRELALEEQPQSSNPDFWDVWTYREQRDVDWNKIAVDWQRDAVDPV